MNGRSKINRIRQIVQLKQITKRWHALAQNRKVSALAPAFYDSDEECCRTPVSPPPDVPEGYLAVYVGRERRRFIIPTDYLSRPVFRTLLDRAEEEFGFDHKGGLTIPCETEVFEHLLRALARNESVEHLNLYCKERESPTDSVHVHSNLLHESMR
jgi:SAUR family protein